MGRMAEDASAAEQLAIAAAIVVGGYMLWTLYNTLKNGPGQLAAWLQQQAQGAETSVANAVNSPVIDPDSQVSLFSWLP
jgi:hypothetical protein